MSTIVLPIGITGLTLTAEIRLLSAGDAVVGDTVSFSAETNSMGTYRGTSTLTGWALIRVLNGGQPFGIGYILLTSTGDCYPRIDLSSWFEALPADYASGTAGSILGNLLANVSRIVSATNPQPGIGNLVSLILGNTYHIADNRPLRWVITDELDWDNASVQLDLEINQIHQVVTGVIEDATEEGRPVYFNVLASDIAALGAGEGHYDVNVLLPEDGDIPERSITVVHGENLLITP